MVMYSMSDTRQICVPTDVGGCGTPHEVVAGKNGKYIDCAPCEAWLSQVPSLGWSNHPGGVALTPDEITANAQAEKKAQQAGWQNLAGQIAAAASGLVPAAQAQPQSLVEQLLALGPEQKAALLVLLGAVPVPATAAPPEDSPLPREPKPEPKGAAPAEPVALTFDEGDVVPPEQVDAVLKAAQRRKPRKATAAAAA